MSSALIVDGNSFFRKSFREILNVYLPHLVIQEAADADEAMKQVLSFQPDIVFTDIRLGRKNGLNLSRSIKAIFPDTLVCVFTDYDLPEYRKIAHQYGADFFLLKDSLSGSAVAELIKYALPDEAAGF